MIDAEVIELPGAVLRYLPNWLAADRANFLFDHLLSSLDWEQPEINIAGNKVKIPRKQIWMGDSQSVMHYSGVRFYPQAWTVEVSALKTLLFENIGQQFNSVLINLYRDGLDSVSWHADDEKELGEKPRIASLSLGATRKFSLKRKDGSVKPLHINLNSGDLLIMEGETQRHWMHCVAKDRNMLSDLRHRRINLTFRTINP